MRDTVGMLNDIEKVMVNNFVVEFRRVNADSEVIFVSAKREKDYLKVTITRNGTEDWYHVISNGTWY